MGQRRASRKTILPIFKCKNEFPEQLVLEKQMRKMRSFVCLSCLLHYMVLKLSKIMFLLLFFADVSKKSKAPIAIHLNASFCSFRKWYWLSCYDLEFRRYQRLKLMNFVKILLSHLFLVFYSSISHELLLRSYKTCCFLKEDDELFQMDKNKLLQQIQISS